MKYITLFVVLIFILSCNKSIDATNKFPFSISGNIDGYDGLKIALIPENTDIKDRIITTIENGKFKFKGHSTNVNLAQIKIEEDVVNLNEFSSFSSVIIEDDSVKMHLDIFKEDGIMRFSKPKFTSGKLNLELYNFIVEFEEAIKGGSWVYSDSIRMDSMRKNAYPIARKNALDLISEQFYSGNQYLNVYIFKNVIINSLRGRGMFSKENLSLEDIKVINSLYTSLQSKGISDDEIVFFDDVINGLNSNSPYVKFTDFKLQSIDGDIVIASDVIEQNNYVLIYFWFSACSPCRKFNKEMVENYETLKYNGVEVIGVNVDKYEDRWLKSTKEDRISWLNLYAGDSSGLEDIYDIRGFPYKVIYDKNEKVVELETMNVASVLDWINLSKQDSQ